MLPNSDNNAGQNNDCLYMQQSTSKQAEGELEMHNLAPKANSRHALGCLTRAERDGSDRIDGDP